VFWLHLRNSPIRWTIPVFIGLDLAVLFLRSRHWIGVWPDTGAAAQIPAVHFLGAVGAGAAAWAAGAPRRQRLTEQFAAARVHPTVAEAHRLGATVVVLLVPYAAGYAVGFALTAQTFPPGVELWAGYLTLGLFAILLAACWGWFLGKLLGSMFAALTAVLSWFVLVSAISHSTGLSVVSGPPDMRVDLSVMALRLGAVVLLLVTLLWLPAVERPREAASRLVLPALVAVAIAVALSATAPVTSRAPADEAICVDGSRTRLCIWPEHEKYLSIIEDISTRIDHLPNAFAVPPRINEYGVEEVDYVEDGVHYPIEDAPPYFSIIEGSTWSYAGGIAYAIDNATREGCDFFNPALPDAGPRLNALHAWLEAYLVGGGVPDYSTNARPETQEAWGVGLEVANELSPAEQLSWAEGEVEYIRDRYCQPKA
jgi:hypothetical protein